MNRTYTFPAIRVEKITDGDTYWLHLDTGFRQTTLAHLRLNQWDTPELRRGSEFEKSEARRATEAASDFITEAVTAEALWVRTYKDPDSFGRWLADIHRINDDMITIDLGQYLHEQDLATRWPTRWREIYDPQG